MSTFRVPEQEQAAIQPQPQKQITGILPLELGLALDASGSMEAIRFQVIRGYNELTNNQRKIPGSVFSTLVEFQTMGHIIHNRIPLIELPPLGMHNYAPGGGTALLDGIGMTIDQIAERFDSAEPYSMRVLIAILSDGQENASRKYSLEQIKTEIHYRRIQDDWQFVYLAAGEAAAEYAAKLLIPKDHIINFLAEDVESLLLKFSQAIQQYRLGNQDYLLLMQ